MRILLDESLPRTLARELGPHEVQTVQKRGWSGLKNGELLRLAGREFEVFLTGDQNLQFQQNAATLPIAVIVIAVANNRIEALLPFVPRILETIGRIKPGQLVTIAP
jgi:predicted nuclease of predicted toxin-antitoxin system